MAKILIVEDDERISKPVQEDLEHQNYLVDVAADGLAAINLSAVNQYDLILLDWMLPKLDGLSLCTNLRSQGFRGAILMLTAKDSKYDKIQGLDSGADDYIVKPFDIDELNARIRALLRRNSEARQAIVKSAKLAIDPDLCATTYNGKPINLTPTEYRLLLLFMRNPQRTFSKDELLDRLWTTAESPTDDVIKVHIKGLRQKLAAAQHHRKPYRQSMVWDIDWAI